MGALLNTFGGNAGGVAQNSMNLGMASTALGAVGDIASGIGGYQQASYAAALASKNAEIMRGNAGAALNAGNYEEAAKKEQTGQTIGAERAAQAANGVDVNIGSPVAVRQSTAKVGALDAAMIHYNAARQAYGLTNEADALDAQSKLDKSAAFGSLTSSLFKAGSTILSGSSSVGAKYAGWQLQAGSGN